MKKETHEIDTSYGMILQLLSDGFNHREIEVEIVKGKSTVTNKVAKIK
ncbi:MAG: hypothetical protein GYA51_04360 [Candidatus Methanofastidiosa archaeon]|nr:hypothetical protein [Candidatus Methanofastidiosa archaeon]